MKKLTRKLLISVLSVALALVALGTQTFAWFAMNDTVAARNMTVEVKSDQTFLLIKAGHVTSSGEIQTAATIRDDAQTPSAALLPAANTLDSSATYATVEATSGADLANWYYMASDDPSDYIGSASVHNPILATEKGNYMLINEFSLTVAEGSKPLKNLKVKTVQIDTDGDLAVKVLVAGTDASEEFEAADSAGSQVLRTANLTDTTVENIKIYIYWNGNNEDVYTNNIEALKNTTVTVTFTGQVAE